MKASRAKGGGGLDNIFKSYPLLVMHFPLRMGSKNYEGDIVMLALSLRCLRRYLFMYFGYKISASCFNVFGRALFP